MGKVCIFTGLNGKGLYIHWFKLGKVCIFTGLNWERYIIIHRDMYNYIEDISKVYIKQQRFLSH